jgi:predicted pyridoxine 5'-phosphate oxidase superfamily flavin-nucleotide-binding protein
MSKTLKKLPEAELKKEIREFLKTRKILVLCTASKEGIPRASPMDFYIDKKSDDFDIFITPAPGSKTRNMEENPNISIGIYTPLDTGKVQGMQITCRSTALGEDRMIWITEGELFDRLNKIALGKRKRFLKIVPQRIELLDYSFRKKGYSPMQILDLK